MRTLPFMESFTVIIKISVIIAIAYFFTACTSTKTEVIKVQEMKGALEKTLSSRLEKEKISADIAAEALVDFYIHYKSATDTANTEDDMLLFEYGVYDWDNKGENFELTFSRQIAYPNDELYQISLTLYYKPGDIGNIEEYALWSVEVSSTEEWLKNIKASEGFKQVAKTTPFDYTIEAGEL